MANGQRRSGGVTWGNHVRASGVGTFRRSGVRRRSGRCGGVFGCGGGGGNEAAKTSGLGDSGSSESSGRLAIGQRERGGGDDGGGRSGGRWTGSSASYHAWASDGGTYRRSRVRRGHGECGGGFGGDGSGSSGSAAAKTSGLGHDNKRPAEALETARREVTLEPGSWWRPGQCVRTR